MSPLLAFLLGLLLSPIACGLLIGIGCGIEWWTRRADRDQQPYGVHRDACRAAAIRLARAEGQDARR